MAEFDLLDIHSKEDPLTGRVTFTESMPFRVIMAITAGIIVTVFVLNLFNMIWPGWAGFIYLSALVIGYGLAFIAFFFSRNAGNVQLREQEIVITPKRNPGQFPPPSIPLDEHTKIRISTMQSFRWIFARAMLYVVITKENNVEHRFGLIIKNKQKQQQYLAVLESWYRAGYELAEYDQLGNRVFKINQGKSYAEVQKIKQEYDLDWQ